MAALETRDLNGPIPASVPQGKPVVFDLAQRPLDSAAAAATLARDGVIQLRNAFPAALTDEIARRADVILSKPAVAGAPGYAKIDHPKRVANPMQIGRPMIELATDHDVLDVVERYMDSDCVLAEAILKLDEPVGYTYFAMHSDFAAGWRKSATAKIVLTQDDLKHPVGVGGVLYLHDTAAGAFSYCLGTHTLGSPRGQSLAKYPADEQKRIMSSWVRLDGQKGDLILFDDRGFHGPDQPASARRIVVLLDYYRIKTFGFAQVSPLQVYTSDLGGLDARQLRVMGLGAEPMVPPDEYLFTRFRRNRFVGLCRMIVENAYFDVHVRQKIKQWLGIKPGGGSGSQV